MLALNSGCDSLILIERVRHAAKPHFIWAWTAIMACPTGIDIVVDFARFSRASNVNLENGSRAQLEPGSPPDLHLIPHAVNTYALLLLKVR